MGRLFVVREVTAEEKVERLALINTAVLDATRDGICLVDLGGRVELVNKAMEQMFGDLFPALDLNETLLELVDAVAVESVHPEAYREHLGAIAADPDFEGEYELELLSGRRAERYTSPVRDADGELVGRLFGVRETTRERGVEELKAELFATGSHQL